MDTGAKAFATGFKKEMAEIDKTLKTTVSKGVQEFSKLQLSAQRAMNAPAGKGAGGIGGRSGNTANAAYQLQDIAVQMQMGAKATVIIAQQVPQLLGPTYAVAGAAIALGGALVTAGQASTEAFKSIIKGAGEAGEALRKVDKTDLHGLIEGFDAAQKKMEELGQTRRTGVSGFLANGIEALSGGDPLSRDHKRAEAEVSLAGQMSEAQERAVQGAKEQLQVEQLKAKGDEEAAGALKKEIELSKTLYAIEKSGFDAETKAQLSQTAHAMAQIRQEGDEQKAFEEWNKRTDKMAEETKKLNAEIDQTPVQRIQGLAQAYRDAVDAEEKANKKGDGEGIVKARLDAAKARVELGKELKSQNDQAIQDGHKREAQEEHSKEIVQSILDKATRITDLAKKGLQGLFDQYGLEAQTKELAKQLLTAQQITGTRVMNAANALIDPQAARAERAKIRSEEKADRTVAEREVNAIDAKRRNAGLDPLSPAQRAREIENRRHAARDIRHPKNKISIDDADITKLANAMMAAAAQQNAK